MSRKLNAFKLATIMPQATCNYQIAIPNITRSIMAVETATLPFKKTVSQSVYIRGLQYQIPVKQTAQGSWSCTMSENIFMSAMYQSLCNQHIMKGGEYAFKLGRIYIYVTDALTGTAPVATCILDGCYLTDIKELSLSAGGATEVMKVTLTFQYNDILDPIDNSVVGKLVDMKAGSDTSLRAQSAFLQESKAAAMTAAAWGTSKLASKINIKELLGI